MPNKFL
jgi:hypothetical protein